MKQSRKILSRGYLDYEYALKYRTLAPNNRCMGMTACSGKIHLYCTRTFSLQIKYDEVHVHVYHLYHYITSYMYMYMYIYMYLISHIITLHHTCTCAFAFLAFHTHFVYRIFFSGNSGHMHTHTPVNKSSPES